VQNKRVKCPTNQLNCNVCTNANSLSERDSVAGGGEFGGAILANCAVANVLELSLTEHYVDIVCELPSLFFSNGELGGVVVFVVKQ